MIAHRTNPALLIGGGELISVHIARHLGQAGIPVHALGASFDPISRSRHCVSATDLGTGIGVQERWLGWLEQEGPRDAVIIPCSDDALDLLAHNRGRLRTFGYHPIEANDQATLAMLDKRLTYELAGRIGIEMPHNWSFENEQQLQSVLGDIELPCAIKPLVSHRFRYHFPSKTKAVVVADRASLRQVANQFLGAGVGAMAVSIIPGGARQLVSFQGYASENGELLSHYVTRKLRQFPPDFGVGTYLITDRDDEAVELGAQFVRKSRLRGQFHVEFKRGAHDGRLRLIECNPRFNISVALAGPEASLLAYRRALGEPAEPIDSPRLGLRLWNPVRDTYAALEQRRAGELTLPRWAGSILKRKRLFVFRFSDPGPTVAFLGRVLKRAVRRPPTRPKQTLPASSDLGSR